GAKPARGKPPAGALLLLDEPTTGLHREDVDRLLGLLQRLADRGHSLIVVEHHRDVLAACDWLAELGPEAGPAGGKLVAEGAPAEVARRDTPTGRLLAATSDGFVDAPPARPRRGAGLGADPARGAQGNARGAGWPGHSTM
ncbi:MAG: hypothetical protein ACO21B_03000, partial [Gemmobacter sp.]